MLKSWTDLYFALEQDYWKAARIATKKSAQLTVNETAAIWTNHQLVNCKLLLKQKFALVLGSG